MFCPNCKYDYKPGIEKCPDCGADLVEKLEEPKPTVKKEPKFVFLCTIQDFVHANFLKETLEKNNIPCLIKSEGGMMFHPPSQVKIYVPEEKYEESQKIKEQLVERLEEPKPTAKKETKFVFLCTTQNLIYANLIKETLERNNIPCFIKSEGGMMHYPIPYSRPELYVPEEKYEESLKIKEQLVDDL